MNLNAAGGSLTLAVGGAITDADPDTDVTAVSATITVGGAAQNVGAASSPINTNVSNLSVDTSAGGGSQFITNSNTVTALNLNAGSGNVTLVQTLASINDSDPSDDIIATAASITFSDSHQQNIGIASNPIGTSVSDLSVDTSAGGGSQVITNSKALTALNMNAGAGNVSLVVSSGAISDTDAATDMIAAAANITLSDSTAKDFGSSANPIGTSVNDLSVSTAAGNGSQFSTEANGLTGLNLDAGIGNVTLNVITGGVADTDAATDITGTLLNVTLGDPTEQNFGSAANLINTNVFEPTVNTAAGGGSQFLSNSNHINALSLNAGSGNVTLVIPSVPGVLLDVEDGDPDVDITANAASVTLAKPSHQNVGSLVHRISVNVDDVQLTRQPAVETNLSHPTKA